MLPDLNNSVTPVSPNSLITGTPRAGRTAWRRFHPARPRPRRLHSVACRRGRLRRDRSCSKPRTPPQRSTNQFRIGLYPFIQKLYSYFPLTTAINGSPSTSGTINYAAANLASLLDTNMDSNLGSGGTHIDTALTSVNDLICSGSGTVGDGSTATTPQPYVFLVTDGAQDPQIKGVPNGGWSGSNHATTIDKQNTLATVPQCEALKNRGIVVSVLYIPYQPVSPVVNELCRRRRHRLPTTTFHIFRPACRNARRPTSSTRRTHRPTSPPRWTRCSTTRCRPRILRTDPGKEGPVTGPSNGRLRFAFKAEQRPSPSRLPPKQSLAGLCPARR